MVSFQCEGCGDVLTKKKLDAHRGQCRNSSFSCLDCMTHFHGNDYRAHTSCISEDQKYQGALYKEKPTKPTKKTVKIAADESKTPRKAYVEDAPEGDSTNAITIVEVLPEAPPPPPAASSHAQPPVNVFDFLVPSDTPEAQKTSLLPKPIKSKKETKTMDYTPSIVGSEISHKHSKHSSAHDPDYDTRGFSYGADPIPTTQKRDRPKVEYFTPAPKDFARDLERQLRGERENGNHTSAHPSKSDKKRKRHAEERETSLARRPSHDSDNDAIMSDAPPAAPTPAPAFHTGLTGGLTRLLSRDDYSDEERPTATTTTSTRYKDPPSPIRRPKPTQTYIVDKTRGRTQSTNPSSALVKISKNRRDSDESRPRKHHRAHHQPDQDKDKDARESRYHSDTHTSPRRRRHSKTRRAVKAIEYHKDAADGQVPTEQQIVLFKARAELFMSFVTKGPESEQGCSVNKALKRYHRERGDGGGRKEEEEKELWKGLRLRRNERGEVVVFF